MRLWRISDHADLSGRGGRLEAGRWHAARQPVAYLSDHPASALLEILVHLEVAVEDIPTPFQLLTVEAADDLAFETVDATRLPEAWRSMPDVTQSLGDRWLAANQTVLLQVPSVIVPFAWNWLLNPRHGDAPKLTIVDTARVAFDPRLFAR